jgi:hypothetical protein
MRKPLNGLLVIMELGAEWPDWALDADLSGRRVLTQLEGETPLAFAERVGRELAHLFQRGMALSLVAFACNERSDELALEARRQVAGLTLGAMVERKSGKLCFSASERSSGKLRHALSALAQDLATEWGRGGLETTVEFTSETRQSELRLRAASARAFRRSA